MNCFVLACKHLVSIEYKEESIMCGMLYRCRLFPDVLCADVKKCDAWEAAR